MRHVLAGKRVVLVDDSIVRGTTTRRIVEELRRAGAAEVHLRIASPPIMWPCFMGIDMATRSELIAAHHTEEDVGQIVGADSLHYLSLPGLRRAMGRPDGEASASPASPASTRSRSPTGIKRGTSLAS